MDKSSVGEDIELPEVKITRYKESKIGSLIRVDINFLATTFGGYCDYCYDGVKNYDEENVDCGGPNCQSCLVPKKFFNWVLLIIILLWVL